MYTWSRHARGGGVGGRGGGHDGEVRALALGGRARSIALGPPRAGAQNARTRQRFGTILGKLAAQVGLRLTEIKTFDTEIGGDSG